MHVWLERGSRALFVGFLTVMFALAPLICLRICELRHVLADAPQMHAHGHTPDSGKAPVDSSFLAEMRGLLLALIEFAPVAALHSILLVAISWLRLTQARLRTVLIRVRPQPPRVAV